MGNAPGRDPAAALGKVDAVTNIFAEIFGRGGFVIGNDILVVPIVRFHLGFIRYISRREDAFERAKQWRIIPLSCKIKMRYAIAL